MAFPAAKKQPVFNPQTRRAHRGEVFWQILLPLFTGVLAGGVLFYLLLAGGASSVERGAQIVLILLALPTLLLGFGLLALLLVLNHGIGKLMNWLPAQSARAQHFVEIANGRTQRTASTITRAFMKLESWGGAVRRVFKRNR
ncbi:MAG TPA: hypothetical protein VI688_07665 [Anaerolineales bacterium]|nr:hypothetical protein [Anaerolineales bacterium]